MISRRPVLLTLAIATLSVASLPVLAASRKANPVRIFDTDNDGTLDLAEVKKAASALFAKLDRDQFVLFEVALARFSRSTGLNSCPPTGSLAREITRGFCPEKRWFWSSLRNHAETIRFLAPAKLPKPPRNHSKTAQKPCRNYSTDRYRNYRNPRL